MLNSLGCHLSSDRHWQRLFLYSVFFNSPEKLISIFSLVFTGDKQAAEDLCFFFTLRAFSSFPFNLSPYWWPHLARLGMMDLVEHNTSETRCVMKFNQFNRPQQHSTMPSPLRFDCRWRVQAEGPSMIERNKTRFQDLPPLQTGLLLCHLNITICRSIKWLLSVLLWFNVYHEKDPGDSPKPSVYCKISPAWNFGLGGLPQMLRLCCVPALDYICTDSYGQNGIRFCPSPPASIRDPDRLDLTTVCASKWRYN